MKKHRPVSIFAWNSSDKRGRGGGGGSRVTGYPSLTWGGDALELDNWKNWLISGLVTLQISIWNCFQGKSKLLLLFVFQKAHH